MKTLRDSDVRARVDERLALLRPDSARRWGRMNASQMLCHLTDAFLGVMMRFVDQLGDVARRPHFLFGYLTPEEWARWGYRHIDHHLRQFGV